VVFGLKDVLRRRRDEPHRKCDGRMAR
jgi:hypothetical protein